MRILELEIEGFRSIRHVTWKPGRLNVVIGPNGSGKSNLLRVLELLTTAGKGGLGDYIQSAGGMDPLLWDGQAERLHFRTKMSPVDESRDEGRDSLTYDLILDRIGKSSSYRISSEVLGNYYRVETGEKPEPFKLLERHRQHAVVFDSQEHGLVAPEEKIDEEETLLSATAGPVSVNPLIDAFQPRFANWRVYEDIHTDRASRMRQAAVARNEPVVDSDGQNLISVLHTLYTSDRDFKSEVNTAVRSAFSDDFEELIFPPVADQRIQLRVRWRSLQREQSAADLSDGTLRFLFLLAVLANPKPPPLIAIDEPETGLHPSMLPIVAEYARDAALRTQVILTTHSPEFLDAFADEAPTTTVVEWHEGETQLKVVSGDELEFWLDKYTLGELYRSRELEAMQ